jgi:hypothetical protein
MKCSTCLSAFLVALSLASSGVASAAPPVGGTAAGSPVLVAQASLGASGAGEEVAQTSDSSGSGTGSSTGAPADGSSNTGGTQPAVSVGTSTTPQKDKPQAAPEEAKPKPKPRPFAGSQIYATTSMSTQTIFRGQQQDYNPTVEQAVWLQPRYSINKDFQLRGRTIVTYEFTNSDSTTYRNEPILSDTTLQLFYRSIPDFAGIKPMIAVNAGLPTSKLSRARTLMFAPGVTGQLSKGFEHVLGGEVSLITSVTYSHPIYQSRQPEVVDPRGQQTLQCVGGASCGDLIGGSLNPSDTLSYMFLVAGEWGKFSPGLLYFGGSSWVYRPKEIMESDVIAGGNAVPVTGSSNPTSVRQTHFVSAFLDYHFNTWFTGEVGYQMSRSIFNESGQYGNPFFDRYQDMRVYLGANFNIDNLMKTLEGGEAEAGIVRAHNTKKPFGVF